MPANIKAVIWDMGGVLLQDVDPNPRSKLALSYGIDLNDLNEFVFQSPSSQLAMVGEITEEQHWQNVGETFGIPPSELADFQLKFWSGDRVDNELYSFIRNLRGKYQTALLSNAWSGTREALEKYYDCLGVFDHVIISAEVKLAKPDPAIYRLMLNSLNVEPGEAIFVDDLQENIHAANQLGMVGIRFNNTRQAIKDVNAALKQ